MKKKKRYYPWPVLKRSHLQSRMKMLFYQESPKKERSIRKDIENKQMKLGFIQAFCKNYWGMS